MEDMGLKKVEEKEEMSLMMMRKTRGKRRKMEVELL